MDRKKIQG